jgi:hypothetical protein
MGSARKFILSVNANGVIMCFLFICYILENANHFKKLF